LGYLAQKQTKTKKVFLTAIAILFFMKVLKAHVEEKTAFLKEDSLCNKWRWTN
jgi:hypothetical protein